ncbi:hypothetical protein FHT70_003794 [Rhizobium sp. BK049]|nr:hypothetical protein [Rhizobium sp. BK049]
MWVNVNDYFRAGGRICLVGAFALHDTRERFFSATAGYFIRWIDASRSASCGPAVLRRRRRRWLRKASAAFRVLWF